MTMLAVPLFLLPALRLLLVSITCAACAFYLLAIIAAVRFFRGKASVHATTCLPVSLLIPLRGAEIGAYESYAALCCQDYADYQLVFGVCDPCDTAIPIVRQLMTNFPERDIALVVCADTFGTNPKVSNLHNMLRCVKYEQIVIVDSDIRVGRDYLRTIIPWLNDTRVGLVTCLYRAAQAPDLATRLEAIGITAEFAPGVLSAWLLEGMHFALGSTMATTKTVLKAIGGLQAIGDHLADDFMLGHLIAKAGYEVRLAHYVVETVLTPMGFRCMLKHQVRWSRSTRISRPLGYLGVLLTHGTPLALLTLLASHGARPSLILLGTTLSLRLTMAWLIGIHWLHDRVLQKYFWLLPWRDLLSFGIWCLGLVGKQVEWRGQVFEIVDNGKIMPVYSGQSKP